LNYLFKHFIVFICCCGFTSCENTINEELTTLKVNNLILKDEKGNEYNVKIQTDSLNKPILKLEKVN